MRSIITLRLETAANVNIYIHTGLKEFSFCVELFGFERFVYFIRERCFPDFHSGDGGDHRAEDCVFFVKDYDFDWADGACSSDTSRRPLCEAGYTHYTSTSHT